MYEELIKALRDRADTLYNASRLYDSDAKDAAILYKAAVAIEELQGRLHMIKKITEWLGKQVPHWIPVTERLPEPFDRVIVYDMRWGVLSAMKGEDESWGGRNDIVIEKVTHWMPLPEPPAEGGE